MKHLRDEKQKASSSRMLCFPSETTPTMHCYSAVRASIGHLGTHHRPHSCLSPSPKHSNGHHRAATIPWFDERTPDINESINKTLRQLMTQRKHLCFILTRRKMVSG
ncbi:hypothetical protein NPIL_548621 [Nephila pilipes]|uniref:Uncharacterized protein n=1 Tax=Nephila pilipes TaxID=299642 RepID=A0A8X6QNC5_NEPPI|nr:hypothetical protein NPIL_548621 [Nephila pilipes]